MTATTGRQVLPGLTNPWISILWGITILTGATGFGLTTSNTDPSDPGYDVTAATIGPPLIVVAGVLLAALCGAGAICWQLRQHP